MKITKTNNAKQGQQHWLTDTGCQVIISNTNDLECISISHSERSPLFSEVEFIRHELANAAKAYAIVFWPKNKLTKTIHLIEYKLI